MTGERKIIIVLSTIIFLGLCLFGYQTFKAHIDNVIAQVKEQDSKTASAKLADAIRERDAAQDKYAKAVLSTQVKTAAQAVQVINHYIPVETVSTQPGKLIEPIKQSMVEVAKEDVPQETQAKLPDSASYVLSTSDQAIQTAKQLQQCDITTHALATCRADLTDSQAQTAIAVNDAETWKKTALGGSRWSRLWGATKWTAVGVGVGVAVGYAANH